MKQFIFFLFIAISLISCQKLPAEELVVPARAAENEKKVEIVPAQKNSGLESVLKLFVSQEVASWQLFNNLAAVQWRDSGPIAADSSIRADAHYLRRGNILLTGFGTTHIPNGKTGPEADSKEDDEGNSGITFIGSKTKVSSIAVMKFYPSEDYQRIISTQLNNKAEVQLIFDNCLFDEGSRANNAQKNKFYRIKLSSKDQLFVEAYVDEEGSKYSPGSTTFTFSRDLPKERIKKMQCTKL